MPRPGSTYRAARKTRVKADRKVWRLMPGKTRSITSSAKVLIRAWPQGQEEAR